MPRVFDEVPVLYGNMTSVMSGGIVYEYYNQESNNYGLVAFYDNGTVQLSVDYDNLQKQFNSLDIKSLESMNSSATAIISPECSSDLIKSNGFANSFDLPSVPSGAQTLIDDGISNPNQGKIVPVTQNSVSLPVYSSSGTLLKNLAIKQLPTDQSNTPSGTDTSGDAGNGSGTTAAATPSASKKSAASKAGINVIALSILLVFALMTNA